MWKVRGMPGTILFSGSLERVVPALLPLPGLPRPRNSPADEQRWQRGPHCVPSPPCSQFPSTGGGAEMGPAAADL